MRSSTPTKFENCTLCRGRQAFPASKTLFSSREQSPFPGSSPLSKVGIHFPRKAVHSPLEGSPLLPLYPHFPLGSSPLSREASSPLPKIGIHSPGKAVYSPTVRCTIYEYGGTYLTSMVNEKPHSHQIQELYTVQRKAALCCQ